MDAIPSQKLNLLCRVQNKHCRHMTGDFAVAREECTKKCINDGGWVQQSGFVECLSEPCVKRPGGEHIHQLAGTNCLIGRPLRQVSQSFVHRSLVACAGILIRERSA